MALLLFLLSLLIHNATAALVNATIDDQNFTLITYTPTRQWNHQPLQGWENDFYNGSRSFTYTRSATATFVFTGSAIWAIGPFAPDQAQRRITLDGVDQGAYNALAPDRSPSRPFWSKTDLVYTTHTLIITHDDPGPNAILALDRFIVEYDNAEDPFPYTTTTVTSYAPGVTVTTDYTGQIISTVINGGGPNQGGTINGNPNNDSLIHSRKSYSAIIIGIVVPVVAAFVLCCVGFCLYRKRRARTREKRRQSFREKMFRRIGRQPIELNPTTTPLSPMYNDRVGANRRMRERRISGFTYASTHYSTAEEYPISTSPPPSGSGGHFTPTSPTPFAVSFGRESDESARWQGTTRYQTETAPGAPLQGMAPHTSPLSFPPEGTRRTPPPTTTATATTTTNQDQLDDGNGNVRSTSSTSYQPTFNPPAAWDSTPSSRLADVPVANASAHMTASGALSTEAHTANGGRDGDPNVHLAKRGSVSTTSAPSAYATAVTHQRQPSTIFSDSESSASHQQQQQLQPSRRPVPLRASSAGNTYATQGRAPPSRPNSMLRRFSQALGRSFSRSGESDIESNNRNSHLPMQNTTTANPNTNTASRVPTTPTTNTGLDEQGQDPGYFRGMNHFNLGIPLNYRPSASAATDATRFSRQLPSPSPQNLDSNNAFANMDESPTGLRSMTRAANGRMDDLAFSSYTQPTRERVLNRVESSSQYHSAHETNIPPSSTEEGDGDDGEDRMEKEKIIEAFDGSTIEGSMRAWSVGHGTMASQGTMNNNNNNNHMPIDGEDAVVDGDDQLRLARTGSHLSSRRSRRSISHERDGHSAIPPPSYSVYIPPDTKGQP